MFRPKLSVVLVASCVTFIASVTAIAQVIPPYDLGGASKPNPDLSFRKANQYKRVHQSSLRFILRNKLDETEAFLNGFLSEYPDDAESHYMLGILYGQRGDIDKAEEAFRKALAAGLPEGRVLAGPREMVAPLARTSLVQKLNEQFRRRLVHGPMLGNVTGDSVSLWMRTATESELVVIARPVNAPDQAPIRSTPTRSKADQDFTAVVKLDGLQPQTEYTYQVLQDGVACEAENDQTFRTLFAPGEPGKFVIAFGGGAGYVPQNERMWDTIGRFDPHAILLFGDNVYIDDPESVVMQQYTYQRRQSRPEWRRLTARSPVFTIWDDHDFGTNDCWGGADIATPFWKQRWVFPIYRQNWANPGYGQGDEQPGCWYRFQIADVDFFMLDCRYYRTNPRETPRSMLGAVQKQWLKQELKQSDGTFKVLCSSVPWDFRTKGDSLDTWNGYPEEHEELLSFLETENVEGVLLMSADRHRSDAWRLTRPKGYDLYEFNSSRLTNQHVHNTMEAAGAIFSYNRPQSFGLVTFDTTLEDPEVRYDVININGVKPHSITVTRSKLRRSE